MHGAACWQEHGAPTAGSSVGQSAGYGGFIGGGGASQTLPGPVHIKLICEQFPYVQLISALHGDPNAGCEGHAGGLLTFGPAGGAALLQAPANDATPNVMTTAGRRRAFLRMGTRQHDAYRVPSLKYPRPQQELDVPPCAESRLQTRRPSAITPRRSPWREGPSAPR
jgi:hypothetical protein